MTSLSPDIGRRALTLADKIRGIQWGLLLLIAPALLIVVPAALVLKQPDLGTAMMLLATGIALLFLAGTRLWVFAAGALAAGAAAPIAWSFLRDYQKTRLYTFLEPDR